VNSKKTIKLENVSDIVDGCTIYIESECNGFSSYKTKIGKVVDIAQIREIQTDDSPFPREDKDITAIVETVDIIFDDIRRKLDVFDMGKASECTMREFISPVLVGTMKMLNHALVKMSAERKIKGRYGQGPLDYDILYHQFHICIAEAKRENMDEGLAQNIIQLVSSRDEFILSKKRQHEDTTNIIHIPSCGIVTCGNKWAFTRYEYHDGQWNLLKSNEHYLNLEIFSEFDSTRKEEIKVLVLIILKMLRFQVEKVDEFSVKRQKTTDI
jgi:hypothetical protein